MKYLSNMVCRFLPHQTLEFLKPYKHKQRLYIISGASIEPTVAGSSDDGNDVQEEESTSKITPLDELSPRHTKRRTDALFSLLKEEAEEQKITTTQLLGFLLHRENYIHDRAVAGLQQ